LSWHSAHCRFFDSNVKGRSEAAAASSVDFDGGALSSSWQAWHGMVRCAPSSLKSHSKCMRASYFAGENAVMS